MIIAAKKEGRDIPITEMSNENLSNKLFFQIAQNIPIITPVNIAKPIDTVARINVFGNVSERISLTFFLD